MRIRVREIVDTPVLSGAQAGTAMLGRVVALLPAAPPVQGALFLDFDGIELVTASFMREFALPLKGLARKSRSLWYPVVANASQAILEELEIVTVARSDPMLTCKLDPSGKVTKIQLVGKLDAKQLEAYEYVTARDSVTAKQLMEATMATTEKATSPTAWNNRLSVLVDKGLVAEANLGRQKVYIPILKEERHGQ